MVQGDGQSGCRIITPYCLWFMGSAGVVGLIRHLRGLGVTSLSIAHGRFGRGIARMSTTHAGYVTDKDLARAKQCENCPVCRQARAKQRGFAFWFVKNVEGGLCPACRAYEKVHGRPAHAPVPGATGPAAKT